MGLMCDAEGNAYNEVYNEQEMRSHQDVHAPVMSRGLRSSGGVAMR